MTQLCGCDLDATVPIVCHLHRTGPIPLHVGDTSGSAVEALSLALRARIADLERRLGESEAKLDEAHRLAQQRGERMARAEVACAAMREALNDLIVIGESEFVAADCGFCHGEGGWTQDVPPTMTPVRHEDGCVLALAKTALSAVSESRQPQ